MTIVNEFFIIELTFYDEFYEFPFWRNKDTDIRGNERFINKDNSPDKTM